MPHRKQADGHGSPDEAMLCIGLRKGDSNGHYHPQLLVSSMTVGSAVVSYCRRALGNSAEETHVCFIGCLLTVHIRGPQDLSLSSDLVLGILDGKVLVWLQKPFS